MRITSKKVLALSLTVAMLLSCIVFSFSASAAVTRMWWNGFEGDGTATVPYDSTVVAPENSATVTANSWNSRPTSTGYNLYTAIQQEADGNDYMALAFSSGYCTTANHQSWRGVAGFQVTHTNATVKNGTGAGSGDGYTNGSQFTNGRFQLKGGSKYAIKLDYRVQSIAAGATNGVNLCLSVSNAPWNNEFQVMDSGATFGTGTNYKFPVTEVLTTVTAADDADTWHTAIAYVEVATTGNLNVLAMRNGSASSLAGTELWVDNIEVFKYAEMSDFPSITVHYGDWYQTQTGLPGAAYTMPTLPAVPANAELAYYTDAAFTQPLEAIPTVYPNESMDIYIKAETYLANDPWGFETEAVGATISSRADNKTNGGAYVVSDEFAHSGSQSAKLNMKVPYAIGCTRNQFMLKNGSDNSIVAVEAGKSYLFSYWAMVPTDAPREFKGNLWLAGRDSATTSTLYNTTNMNNTLSCFRDAGAANYVTVPKDGQWHRVVRYISGDKVTASSDGNLLVGLSDVVGDTEGEAPLYVYIDDVDLVCLDDLAASYTERVQYQFGEEVTVGNETKLTHLHSYVGTKPNMTGAYTSIRLGDTYTVGSAADSIVLGGVELTLNARGIIMDTDAAMTADTATYKSEKTSAFDTYFDKDGDLITYTLRLANISKDVAESDTEYYYRSYYKITLPKHYKENAQNVEVTDTQVTTYGELSGAFTLDTFYQNLVTANKAGVWFE